MKELLFIFLLSSLSFLAEASVFTGKPSLIEYQIREGGQVRFSIWTTNKKTSCSVGGWYIFQSDNLQQVQLLATAAQHALDFNKTIEIYGTGECDEYAIETIEKIRVIK